MFECELCKDAEVKNGNSPDSMQVGVEWLSLNKLDNYRIYPKILKELLGNDEMAKKKYI